MMEFEDHPSEPNTIVIKMMQRHIAKHSDEDLQAAVLAEREACAQLCLEQDEYGCGQYARAIRARGDMSTKSQNSDTSEERVQKTDKSIHEEIERLKTEIKRANELAEYGLQLLMKIPENRPWVSLTDEEIDYIWGVTPPDYENFFEFPRAIEAKLKEKNNA
jgi:hypothetical protein